MMCSFHYNEAEKLVLMVIHGAIICSDERQEWDKQDTTGMGSLLVFLIPPQS